MVPVHTGSLSTIAHERKPPTMRKLAASAIITLGAVGASAAGAAGASAPPDTIADEPPATEPAVLDSTATVDLAPGDTDDPAASTPAGHEPVIVVDRNGAELAAMTVVEVEPGWTGHEEYRTPDAGNEYTRVTVLIESRIPRGVFDYSYHNFSAQDADGFEIDAQDVDPADGENQTQTGSLAAGESAEVQLTFEGLIGAPIVEIFYSPSGRLVTVAEL